MTFTSLNAFEESLGRIAPFMANSVEKGRNQFGEEWCSRFDETLRALFSDPEDMRKAAEGYTRFALEATRLQKRFERDKAYISKTYEEAAAEVYHNREYMESMYLPGVLLTHYLWPHHYNQLLFFRGRFLPLIAAASRPFFNDVGIGSGFYSRQILTEVPNATGRGYDISEHSAAFAKRQLGRFDVLSRWSLSLVDVITNTPMEQCDFLVSVEVLEHLEDPLAFLCALRKMLAPGGSGFITAAITAPNADHIYLYNTIEEVAAQIVEAGFSIVEQREDIAYPPRKDEPVPRLAAFIVT